MIARLLLLSRLALRNLRRQARRSLLTGLAMIVGGAMLMISLPLGDGAHEEWIDSGVRTGSGHISIEAPGFHASGKIEQRLPAAARAAARAALTRPEIARHIRLIVPRLTVGGLASSPSGARPVQVVGVESRAEADFSILDERVVEGRYLEDGDRLAAYVGSVLAEGLELKLGSRLVLTAQDANGDIAGQLVRVVGIFRTGIPEVDQALIHIPLATAGAWLGTGDDVTNIAVLLDSSRRVPHVLRALERALAGASSQDISALSWRDAMPELDAAVKIDEFGDYIFHGILFGIIALGIVNTVLMSVMYRRREFGMLRAMGLTPGQTGGLVMVEGLILTTLSGVIGLALGLFITWFFWRDGFDFSFAWNEEWSFSGVVMDPIVMPLFSAARVVQSLVFLMVIGLLASLYPAHRATRIDVAEAMKFER